MTTYAQGGPYGTSIASLPQGYCEEDPRPGTRRRQSQETQSKPVREATLLAMIKSLLVAKDDDPIIQKTLNDTMAAGKITISETGPVQYSL